MQKFAVIGPARAGKSTFATYLAEALGTKAVDTSEWLVQVESKRQEVLQERFKSTTWLYEPVLDGYYKSGWDPDRNRPARELLIALGDAVCALQPDFLIEQCLKKGDIIVGIRRQSEFDHLPDGVQVVWIDRTGTTDGTDSKHLDIPRSVADVIVNNNGSLDDLRHEAERIARIASVSLNTASHIYP